MSRYTGPKNRIARRFGANIFGRLRNPLLHKGNPPGQHGARRRKKSDYGLQLEEKQKLRAVYGMLQDHQLARYYKEAVRRDTNTVNTLIEMLESRLDIVVFRLGFSHTVFGAQQLVSHGHILVDNKRVDRRGFQVRPGQTISVREKSRQMPLIRQSLERTHSTPGYVELNKDKFEGRLLTHPMPDQVPFPLEINLPTVCEFLAHTT